MGENISCLIADAQDRGQAVLETTPLALAAAYEVNSEMLIIHLKNGCKAEIPANLVQGLADAAPQVRANVEVSGIGYGLYWPDLDLDLSVPGLLAGVFGTKAWMNSQRAATAGAATSDAKSQAARRNGSLGGRPRKSLPSANA